MSSIFDELLDRAISEYVLGVIDHEDRERERCDTGRPHSPFGWVWCKCQPAKDFIGLQGFLADDRPEATATILWYGNFTADMRNRTARIVDITEA